MAREASPIKIVVAILLITLGAGCASRQGASEAADDPESAVLARLGQTGSHADVDWSLSCKECHAEITPAVTEAWYDGMHGQVNIGCFICHGDGEVEFFPKPGDDRCVSCHSGKAVHFAEVDATSCFSCHDGHTLRFHGD